MASKRKQYKHLEKRNANGTGSWFLDISIPKNVRHHYSGRARMRQSLKTVSIEKAIIERNRLLQEMYLHKSIADLSDFNPEASPSTAYNKAIETYSAASPEEIDNLVDEYELEHNLHSSSNQPVANHPTYFALRDMQRNDGVRRTEFGSTLLEALEMFLIKRHDLSKASVRSYKVAVNIYGPDVVISQIALSDVNHWCDRYTGSRSSVKSKLSSLSMIWDFCRNRAMVDENARNPFQGLDLSDRTASKKTEPMTPKLLQRILELAPASHHDFWRVCAMTGCRGAELASLEFQTISGDPFLKVKRSKTESGIRLIAQHPSIAEVDIDNLVSSDVVRHWLTKTRKAGLLDGYGIAGIHGCRVSFVTSLRDAGVDRRIVSALAGHSSSNVTDRYDAGVQTKVLTEAVLKLPIPWKIA